MPEYIQYWPLLLLTYPAYVLVMAGVLLSLGVKKDKVRKWALGQAHRHRLIDLVRAARGLPQPPPKKKAEPSSPAETPPPPAEDPVSPLEDDTPQR